MVGNHDRSEIGRRYSPPDNTFERSVKALGRWLLQIIIGIVLWMLWTTVKYYIGILPAIAAILIVGAVSILIIVRLGHSGSTEASAYRVPGTSMTCSNCSASFLIQARAQCGVPCPSCGGLTSEEARRRSLVLWQLWKLLFFVAFSNQLLITGVSFFDGALVGFACLTLLLILSFLVWRAGISYVKEINYNHYALCKLRRLNDWNREHVHLDPRRHPSLYFAAGALVMTYWLADWASLFLLSAISRGDGTIIAGSSTALVTLFAVILLLLWILKRYKESEREAAH